MPTSFTASDVLRRRYRDPESICCSGEPGPEPEEPIGNPFGAVPTPRRGVSTPPIPGASELLP
jgi:hypothetical protein